MGWWCRQHSWRKELLFNIVMGVCLCIFMCPKKYYFISFNPHKIFQRYLLPLRPFCGWEKWNLGTCITCPTPASKRLKQDQSAGLCDQSPWGRLERLKSLSLSLSVCTCVSGFVSHWLSFSLTLSFYISVSFSNIHTHTHTHTHTHPLLCLLSHFLRSASTSTSPSSTRH
jgi:hypothetical protein